MSTTSSTDPAVLQEAVSRIVQTVEPRRVILFGSAARGDLALAKAPLPDGAVGRTSDWRAFSRCFRGKHDSKEAGRRRFESILTSAPSQVRRTGTSIERSPWGEARSVGPTRGQATRFAYVSILGTSGRGANGNGAGCLLGTAGPRPLPREPLLSCPAGC